VARRAYLWGNGIRTDEGGLAERDATWLEESSDHVFNPNVESDSFSGRSTGIDFRELKKQTSRATDDRREARDDRLRRDRPPDGFCVVYWDDSAQRGAGTKGD